MDKPIENLIEKYDTVEADRIIVYICMSYVAGFMKLLYNIIFPLTHLPEINKVIVCIILLIPSLFISAIFTKNVGIKEFYYDCFEEFEHDKNYPHAKWNIISLLVFLGGMISFAYFVNLICI